MPEIEPHIGFGISTGELYALCVQAAALGGNQAQNKADL